MPLSGIAILAFAAIKGDLVCLKVKRKLFPDMRYIFLLDDNIVYIFPIL